MRGLISWSVKTQLATITSLVIKMDRPQKRNALNGAMTAGIDAAMNELEDDPGCGAAS